MVKGYTTQTVIEEYMLQDIAPTYATQLAIFIEAMEREIEKVTGRVFIADSAASARVFDGDGSNSLLIDDCIAITKVEVGLDSYGGTFQEVLATGSNRYFTEPANAAVKGIPFDAVVLSAQCFTEGIQNNRVTAKWGYSVAVPKDIQFVATVFVAGILNQLRGAGDGIKSEKIGAYMVTYSNDTKDSFADFELAKQILDSYKRFLL